MPLIKSAIVICKFKFGKNLFGENYNLGSSEIGLYKTIFRVTVFQMWRSLLLLQHFIA